MRGFPGLLLFAAVGCAKPAADTTEPTTTPAPADESDVGAADADPAPPERSVAAAPAPLPAEQREILDRINDRYAEETDPRTWSARFEREGREVRDRQPEVLAALQLSPGLTVADVGSGTGLYTLPFAAAVGAKGRVFAVDVQPYFLDHVRQRATKAGHEHIVPILADAESAQLPAGELDLIFMCDAYHHVEQPTPYLASLRAAMKPDGRLVIVDYRRGDKGTWRYGHIRATPAEFRAEIEAAGFTLDRELDLLEENFFFVFRPV